MGFWDRSGGLACKGRIPGACLEWLKLGVGRKVLLSRYGDDRIVCGEGFYYH